MTCICVLTLLLLLFLKLPLEMPFCSEKDPMDYNGLESHIAGMFARDKADFFPVSRAMSLDLLSSLSPDPFTSMGDKFAFRFNDIEKKVDNIDRRMTKMDEVLEKVLAYVSDV